MRKTPLGRRDQCQPPPLPLRCQVRRQRCLVKPVETCLNEGAFEGRRMWRRRIRGGFLRRGVSRLREVSGKQALASGAGGPPPPTDDACIRNFVFVCSHLRHDKDKDKDRSTNIDR